MFARLIAHVNNHLVMFWLKDVSVAEIRNEIAEPLLVAFGKHASHKYEYYKLMKSVWQ